VGDTASLSFDAIPILAMIGKVSRIRSLGENRQGDIVYTVSVQPEKMDERLRWNMTTKVSNRTQAVGGRFTHISPQTRTLALAFPPGQVGRGDDHLISAPSATLR